MGDASAKRPLPHLDDHNRAFWTGGAEGRLYILRCRSCGAFIHPPRPVCGECLSDAVEPEAVAGTGVVDTFTVNHQQWHPALPPPYVIARVALDGVPGVYLTTNIVGCGVDEVAIGDRVRVTFLPCEDVHLPVFEKVRD